MPRSNSRLLLALTLLLSLAGCQLTDIEKGDCQSGETKCIAGNIHTCNTKGFWSEMPTTECGESGCSEGTIQPANAPLSCFGCGNDESKCDGSDLVICSNHQQSKTSCDNGCMQTDTVAYCRDCKDDEFKCDKGFIVSCAKDGDHAGKWDDDHKLSCGENGCFSGARGNADEVKCYECSTDKPKCFRDENTKVETIKKCLAHNWYDDEICEFGCFDEPDAVCKECDRDRYFNHEDGYCIKQLCKDGKNEQEAVFSEVSCNKAMDGIGVCLNGSSRCFDKGEDQGAFQYCEDGAWKDSGITCDPHNPCALLGNNKCLGITVGQICGEDGKSLIACRNNASCKSDSSGCSECQTGTSKCNNTNVLECLDGSYVESLCGPGTHCEFKDGKGQCVKHDCENGKQRCQLNVIQTCENYQWKTVNACGDGEQCVEINDTAACSCTSTKSYCDSNQIKRCTEGQWQTIACGITENCTLFSGDPKCIECQNSFSKCVSDTQFVRCRDYHWASSEQCADNMKCVNNVNSATCKCTSGQAKCASDNTKIIKCKDNGMYGNAELCGTDKHCEGVAGSAVCTANPMECSPGERRCKGDELQTCNSKGKWEAKQTCDKGCSHMTCNECNGDEKICEDNTLKTCSDGQWTVGKCLYGCNPKRVECYPECLPGNKKCERDIFSLCGENGQWQKNTCELGCRNGECINTIGIETCESGETQCTGKSNMKICVNNKWETAECPQGNSCDVQSQSCIKCEDEPICLNSNAINNYLRIPCQKDVPDYSNIAHCKDEKCTACE